MTKGHNNIVTCGGGKPHPRTAYCNHAEPEPAPRAAERERVDQSKWAIDPYSSCEVVQLDSAPPHLADRIAQTYGVNKEQRAQRAAQIVTEHNQHSTLIEQRQWLIETLRDEIHALELWKKAKGLPIDVADGIAISLSKLSATITTIEQSVKNAGEGGRRQ